MKFCCFEFEKSSSKQRAQQATHGRIKVTDCAPYGTKAGPVAASPADTPLVEPANPPKIMADCGLLMPNPSATNGVTIVTKTDLITPIAILMAITSD